MGKRWAWFLKGDASRTCKRRVLRNFFVSLDAAYTFHVVLWESVSGKTEKEEGVGGFRNDYRAEGGEAGCCL